MVQPFLGFIRVHEKEYAREVASLKIQLREANALLQRIYNELRTSASCGYDPLLEKDRLTGIVKDIVENKWVVDNEVGFCVPVYCSNIKNITPELHRFP